MVPVCCGTSYKNKGVQKLLDAIVDYMPAPTDVPDIKGVSLDSDEEEDRPSSDDAPFAALAFKIATDPYVGKLCFFRVYSGVVNTGDTLSSTQPKVIPKESVVSFRCMQTTEKISMLATQVISLLR